MLHLKRITHFYEWIKCQISGKIMTYGDWYYEDDEDGLVVDALVYKRMKQEQKEEEWDYSQLQMAKNEREYREKLRELEREYMKKTLLDRKVAYEENRGG